MHPTPITCTDGDVCTDDSCNPPGCVFTPVRTATTTACATTSILH
jgi:hypothetical protein